MSTSKKWAKRTGIVLFWLLLWQGITLLVDNSILMTGPITVLGRLGTDICTLIYWQTIGSSFLKIVTGFMMALILAILFSALAFHNKWLKELLSPFVLFLKAAPIACFIVLLLIWFGSSNLSFFVSVMIAFPPIYLNVLEGLEQTDKGLLEVAEVFRMPVFNKLMFIYRQSVAPYLVSSVSLAIGMSFKAGVAAEIIGTPDFSMGERIYMSKIYLDTAGVLSWMITVIAVCFCFEKLFVFLVKKAVNAPVKPVVRRESIENTENTALQCMHCKVGYEGHVLLDDFTMTFEKGKTYCIYGPSGCGKTTLLRTLAMQMLQCKKGSGIAQSFQENRLLPQLNALDNILITGACSMSKDEMNQALAKILPPESLPGSVTTYSGGMAKRVSVLRALLANRQDILLDEPFSGLDTQTADKLMDVILEYQGQKTIIYTAHSSMGTAKLKAQECGLWKQELH